MARGLLAGLVFGVLIAALLLGLVALQIEERRSVTRAVMDPPEVALLLDDGRPALDRRLEVQTPQSDVDQVAFLSAQRLGEAPNPPISPRTALPSQSLPPPSLQVGTASRSAPEAVTPPNSMISSRHVERASQPRSSNAPAEASAPAPIEPFAAPGQPEPQTEVAAVEDLTVPQGPRRLEPPAPPTPNSTPASPQALSASDAPSAPAAPPKMAQAPRADATDPPTTVQEGGGAPASLSEADAVAIVEKPPALTLPNASTVPDGVTRLPARVMPGTSPLIAIILTGNEGSSAPMPDWNLSVLGQIPDFISGRESVFATPVDQDGRVSDLSQLPQSGPVYVAAPISGPRALAELASALKSNGQGALVASDAMTVLTALRAAQIEAAPIYEGSLREAAIHARRDGAVVVAITDTPEARSTISAFLTGPGIDLQPAQVSDALVRLSQR